MLARLARLFAAALLLTSWQAALDHSVEHAVGAHEETMLCGVLDGLGACAARAPIASAVAPPVCDFLSLRSTAPRWPIRRRSCHTALPLRVDLTHPTPKETT